MKALIIFTPDNRHWAAPLLKRGFRHVYAVIPSPHQDGTSVEVDLTTDGIRIYPIPASPEEIALAFALQETSGVEVVLTEYRPDQRHLLTFIGNTCVGLTKALVGIRSWAVTPYQLYEYLQKEQRQCASTSPSPASAAAAAATADKLETC